MNKYLIIAGLSVLLSNMSGAVLLNADFTKGEDGLKLSGFVSRNIRFATGDNGGIIADKADQYSEASRSASGVFDPADGSLTLEIAPVVDIESFKGATTVRSMTLMEVVGPDKKRMTVGAVMHGDYQIITLNYNDGETQISKNSLIKWPKDETHKVEFIWTADQLTGKLDGKEIFSEKIPAGMFTPRHLLVSGYNNNVFLIRKMTTADTK